MAGCDETFHVVKLTIYKPAKRSHPQFGLLIVGSALESRSRTPAGRNDYAFRYPSWRQVREKAAQQ